MSVLHDIKALGCFVYIRCNSAIFQHRFFFIPNYKCIDKHLATTDFHRLLIIFSCWPIVLGRSSSIATLNYIGWQLGLTRSSPLNFEDILNANCSSSDWHNVKWSSSDGANQRWAHHGFEHSQLKTGKFNVKATNIVATYSMVKRTFHLSMLIFYI